MEDKFKLIKDILKIIISILIIISVTKSCSKAYTWEDMESYATQIVNNANAQSQIKSVANNFLSNSENMKSKLLQNNINVDNFNNFLYMKNGNNSPELFMFNTASNSTASTGRANNINYLNVYNITGKRAREYNGTTFGQYLDITSVATNGIRPYYWFGLIEINFTPTTDMWLQQNFIATTPLEFEDAFDQIVEYNGEDATYYQRRYL